MTHTPKKVAKRLKNGETSVTVHLSDCSIDLSVALQSKLIGVSVKKGMKNISGYGIKFECLGHGIYVISRVPKKRK